MFHSERMNAYELGKLLGPHLNIFLNERAHGDWIYMTPDDFYGFATAMKESDVGPCGLKDLLIGAIFELRKQDTSLRQKIRKDD